jgi:hypothetical protein
MLHFSHFLSTAGLESGFGYVILIDIGMQTWIIGNSEKENAVFKASHLFQEYGGF